MDEELCPECERPKFGKGETCWRCAARLAGEKCSVCGSPWIWITAWPDDKLLCRVCMMAKIKKEGLNDGYAEYVASWKRKAKVIKTSEEDAKILEMQRKLKTRKKPKTEEMWEE